MKSKFLLVLLFSGFFGFSQTATLTLPNLKNEFKIELQKNESDDILVSITDSEKKDGTMWKITSKQGEPVSSFTASVFSKIAQTQDYYFKLQETNAIIKLSSADLKSAMLRNQMASEIKKLDKQTVIALLKTKTAYKDFDNYLKQITDMNSRIPLFTENPPDLAFKKDTDGKIDLFEGALKSQITGISKEDAFFDLLYTHFIIPDASEVVKNVLLTDTAFKELTSVDFRTSANIARLEEILKQAADKQSDYQFIASCRLTHGTLNFDYTVSIKNNFQNNYSILKFCSSNYDCRLSTPFAFDIEYESFKTKIESLVKEINTSYTMSKEDIAILHQKIKSYNEKSTVEQNSKEFKKELSSVAEKLDNMPTKFSGVLSMNREIPVYQFISRCERHTIEKERKKGLAAPQTKNLVKITESELSETWLYKEVKDVKFIVSDTTNSITFFNNKVKSINIVGYLKDNPSRKFSVSNINYSLPLRSLNNSTHYIPISPRDSNAKEYFICINDLLDYGKSENVLSFSVKNKDYAISPSKNIKIEQRKLMDFFTAIIFSDVLGINSENPNSLLLAEGRVKVPLWLYNFGMVSVLNFLNADFNVSLYNGLDEKSRYIKPVNDGQSETVSQYVINNFDYIKYNNFNAGMSLNFFNLEMKGLNSELSFAGGLRYYRTGLRYTYVSTGNADIIKSSQLNSLTYEISTNFEIRPQSNFGADINVGLNWLNARGSTDNIPIVFNPVNNNDEKTMLRLQGNFYMKLDPYTSNDGIYVRMGGFYHLGSKDFYPQILVGYATNLSSFVNGFKK